MLASCTPADTISPVITTGLAGIDWHVGHLTRRLRLSQGRSQAELARTTGVALSKVQRLEDQGHGSLDTLARIAAALETSPGQLYTYIESMKPTV